MLTRLLTAILGFGLDRSQDGAANFIARLSATTARKLALFAVVSVAALMFLNTGLLTIAADLVLSSRQSSQGLALSSVSTLGFAVIGISFLSLVFALRPRVWHAVPDAKRKPSPVEDAVAALILDFISERQRQREREVPQSAPKTDEAFGTDPATYGVPPPFV
jgi:hypothetical protein